MALAVLSIEAAEGGDDDDEVDEEEYSKTLTLTSKASPRAA